MRKRLPVFRCFLHTGWRQGEKHIYRMNDGGCAVSMEKSREAVRRKEICVMENNMQNDAMKSNMRNGMVGKNTKNGTWLLRGVKDGVPIALGYFAVAFALGIAAKTAGMSPVQAGGMSALMLASAGQYAAITVIATDGGYIQMAVTTLIVNLRYLLMSCALSQKVEPDMKMRHRLLMSYPITDEIFGIAMSVEGRLNPFYNYGAALIAGPGWTAGAALGAAAGAILPQRAANALSVALYGMFLAITIPAAIKDMIIAGVVAASMLRSLIMAKAPVLREISSGMQIILLTVLIAGAAAYFFPVKEDAEGGSADES